MRDPVSHPEFQTLYVKSHFRAIPYIIGLIVAYVYIQLKEKQYKFSTVSLVILRTCLLLDSTLTLDTYNYHSEQSRYISTK
jgi:hypothetical protein